MTDTSEVIEQKVAKQAQRRHKKRHPTMRVSGRSMKRFACASRLTKNR